MINKRECSHTTINQSPWCSFPLFKMSAIALHVLLWISNLSWSGQGHCSSLAAQLRSQLAPRTSPAMCTGYGKGQLHSLSHDWARPLDIMASEQHSKRARTKVSEFSIGQNTSQGQLRLKVWGDSFQLLMARAAKSQVCMPHPFD